MTRTTQRTSAHHPDPEWVVGPLRLVLVDPDPLARGAVRRTLLLTGHFTVVGETSSIHDAVELISVQRPDVAVLEFGASPVDALLVIRQILRRAPGVHPVLFTADSDEELQLQALQVGARGAIHKDQGVAGLILGLMAVARGEVAIPRSLTLHLVERVRQLPTGVRGVRPVTSALTDREWEVVDLLSAGATPSEVADHLHLTRETVYRHVKNAMRKLGVHRQADMLRVTDVARQASMDPT